MIIAQGGIKNVLWTRFSASRFAQRGGFCSCRALCFDDFLTTSPHIMATRLRDAIPSEILHDMCLCDNSPLFSIVSKTKVKSKNVLDFNGFAVCWLVRATNLIKGKNVYIVCIYDEDDITNNEIIAAEKSMAIKKIRRHSKSPTKMQMKGTQQSDDKRK